MATLGIDVGGTNARAAVVDGQGQILSAARIALTDRSPEAVVEAIAQAADQAIGNSGVPVHGCGIGVAGQLIGETGVIAVAPNLGWRNVPIRELLNRALGRSVRVVNDLTAAAWGELKGGAGRGAKDVLVVFAGSGVGSAIILHGKLHTGASGVAGEIGHVKVEPDGRRCGCGSNGCLEAYAGGHNLIAQMKELVQAGQGAALLAHVGGDASHLNPAVLEAVAVAGDPAASALYERTARYLAMTVANQVTMLNPERLILGGGVLSHTPLLRQRIAEGIGRWSSETSRNTVQVVSAALGDDSGIIGAALLADLG